jgi:phosphonate transport system ATP-binding protein
MSLIELKGASVQYQGTIALQPTDLRIGRGEFCVLLGPSGAGKSTLLRAINGLVPMSAGQVQAGEDTIASPRDWRMLRRHAAMVFQQHQLIGRLGVLDNVLIGRLGHHGVLRSLLPWPPADRRLALQCLARVGLLEHAMKRADQLSGGQQQRVGLARALAQEPQVLLADEPVASLDPHTAEQVMTLLAEVCRDQGIAALVSLHQVGLARRFAERVIGLRAGRVVFDAPVGDLDDAAVSRIYGFHDTAAQAPEEVQADNPMPLCTSFMTQGVFS